MFYIAKTQFSLLLFRFLYHICQRLDLCKPSCPKRTVYLHYWFFCFINSLIVLFNHFFPPIFARLSLSFSFSHLWVDYLNHVFILCCLIMNGFEALGLSMNMAFQFLQILQMEGIDIYWTYALPGAALSILLPSCCVKGKGACFARLLGGSPWIKRLALRKGW